MKVTRRSMFSGQENTMDLPVTEEQLDRWQAGELIQNVFPNLTADQREFLMTGTMPGEWDDAYEEADDDR